MNQQEQNRQEIKKHLYSIFGTETAPDGLPNMYLIRDDEDTVLHGIDFTPEFTAIVDLFEVRDRLSYQRGVVEERLRLSELLHEFIMASDTLSVINLLEAIQKEVLSPNPNNHEQN